MKLKWNDWFGSNSMEMPSMDSMWKSMLTDVSTEITIEVRMVAKDGGCRVELDFGRAMVTLVSTEAVDTLINRLIKVRDQMEKLKEPQP